MNDHNYEIAVVINCYNYEQFIGAAIESVISQKVDCCEVIVVDDGSRDRSWDIISSYDVKAFKKENGGQVSACLYGALMTDAPFVLFLDADDELLPGSIQEILSHLDDDVAKLQFPLIKIDENGSALGDVFPKISKFRDRTITRNHVLSAGAYLTPPTSGNVFSRQLCHLLHEAHYDSAADGIMLIAAPFFGDIVSLDTPLGRYRVHGNNKSGISGVAGSDTLRRNRDRFAHRIEHLNKILLDRGVLNQPIRLHDLYVYRRYDNYMNILNLKRIDKRSVGAIIHNLPQWYNLPRRILVVAFLLICIFAPKVLLAKIIRMRMSRNRVPPPQGHRGFSVWGTVGRLRSLRA